jgi:hypothetical protein
MSSKRENYIPISEEENTIKISGKTVHLQSPKKL